MLRSRGFLIFLAVAVMVLLLRSRLAVLLPQLPVNPRARTTDTKVLATVFATPESDRSAPNVVSGTSLDLTVTPTPEGASVISLSPGGEERGVSAQSVAEPDFVQYQVRVGDTLFSIAKQYGISVEELAQLNGLNDVNQLFVGQILQVPARVARVVSQPTSNTRVYVVQPGDTLASIGRKLGVSISEIQKLNALSDPNRLTVGQELLVPVPAATKQPKQPGDLSTVDRSVDEQLPGEGQSGAIAQNGGSVTPTPPPRPTRAPVIPPSTPAPTPTATPDLLRAKPYCESGVEQVAVWGVHFCAPEGWSVEEQSTPERAMFLSTTTDSGELVVYAMIRPHAIPNAPLSVAIRSAKNSLGDMLGGQIPGGIAAPASWSQAQATVVSKQQAQSASAETTYGMSGVRATVRVIVFNYEGQRWLLMMIAPTAQWQSYANGPFASITRSLTVF